MNEIRLALIVTLVIIGINYLAPTDETDISRFKRSGMNLRIDHGTGCHYLSGGGFFGKEKLIPRLNKEGKHVCE